MAAEPITISVFLRKIHTEGFQMFDAKQRERRIEFTVKAIKIERESAIN